MDSEKELLISSKSDLFILNLTLMLIFSWNCSEAMQMILSADSPDSEDLNDQNFLEIY